MKKILFFISICLGIISLAFAQQKMTDAQRKEQVQFIRQDTLPVTVEALPTEVNTHFSEYSGRLINDTTFYFTSMRADVEEDNDHIFETSWYCYIYKSTRTAANQYVHTEALPGVINTPNTFNSNFCFNRSENAIIYTRCKRGDDGDLQCSLWQTELGKKGWSKPQKLPNCINEVNSSNMQPFLVDYSDHQVLYFVSNRKKGLGGYDLWYAIVKDGKYGTPINLGTNINTEGNEVTPFYDKEQNTLYFSSDEHLGIGDYDIFYSQGALSQWGEVSNMGVPYNSEYNDYYFTLNDNGESGYFSSNRPHDDMSETDTCCNDLFLFTKQHFEAVSVTEYTLTLAEKIEALFPITLYFENDQPDARSTSDTTATDYLTLYENYLTNLQTYIRESGNGLAGDSLRETQYEMQTFLKDSVMSGFGKLEQLTQYLQQALEQGENIELTISGFASPLHNSDYNKHLSSRRIVSLTNYLAKVSDGYFQPYLKKEKAGLLLSTDPQGAMNHTFATDQKRETVYGLQAAKDRKIVIMLNH